MIKSLSCFRKLPVKHIVVCFLSFILFYSCKEQGQNIQNLRQAENLLWENPDSALIVLALVDTLSLDETGKAQYDLAQIVARAKINKNISGNEIFTLSDYFRNKNDVEREALATLYAGLCYINRNDLVNANKSYLEAYSLADKINDNRLKGLALLNLGLLDFHQGFHKDAIETIQSSLPFLKQNIDYTTTALNRIGNAFFLLGQQDSAFKYFDQIMDIALKSDDSELLSGMLNNIGFVLLNADEYDKAKKYFHEALTLVNDSEKYLPLMNLAKTYHYIGKADSAEYYASQAYQLQDKMDVFSAISLYEVLYEIEKENKNYARALSYHEQLLDSIDIALERQSDKSILDIQKKYKTELLENKIKMDEQVKRLWILGALLTVCIISFLAYFLVQKERRNTEKLKRDIEILRKMADSYNVKERNYRNIALEQFQILKKGALVERILTPEEKSNAKLRKKFYKVTYGNEDFDWDKLYSIINTLQNDFMIKAESIFKEFSELNDEDFKIWCLSYSDFTQDEISVILNRSVRTIQQRNQIMRGIFVTTNIDKFIEEKIKDKYPG